MSAIRLAGLFACAAFWCGLSQAADEQRLPKLDDRPTLQLNTEGPTAPVKSMAFSPDGKTLYAAGFDKVVRSWTFKEGRAVPSAKYRAPVGPGNAGSINALAVSPDGRWLAFGGRSPMRGEAGFRTNGVTVSSEALSENQLLDAGVIYVVDLANPAAGGRVLRGHRGEVRAMIAVQGADGTPLLLSAATERAGDRRYGGARLWNPSTGELVASRDDFPSNPAGPGLASVTSAQGYLIAWPHEDAMLQAQMYFWQPKLAQDNRHLFEADKYSLTAASFGNEVVTGGFGPAGGRLKRWNFVEGAHPPKDEGAIDFPAENGKQFLPVSLVAIPPSAERRKWVAALLKPAPQGEYRLVLADMEANRIAAIIPLQSTDYDERPALATSADRIAVSAFGDRSIQVFSIAGLLSKRPVSPEAVIEGESSMLVAGPKISVGFEEGGRELEIHTGQRIVWFDFSQRKFTEPTGGRINFDVADAKGWQATISPDNKVVEVRRNGEFFPSPKLAGENLLLNAAAVRASADGTSAVLAVAYTEVDSQKSMIALCDGATGRPFRQLVGHVQPVQSLSFSSARPLLVSASRDGVVSLWSLTDLDSAIGGLDGVQVADRNGNVVVQRVDADSVSVRAGLASGDVIDSFATTGGKPSRPSSAADLLLAVSQMKPGAKVDLTIAGKGVVSLPVVRGVDDRKPLFSLAFSGTEKKPEWIGWSPAGPYDASSPAAEARVGWHTNTGDPAAPTAFAGAAEYRKEYLREGILGHLVAEGDLGKALKKWDAAHAPPPRVVTLIPERPEGAVQAERADVFAIRAGVAAVRVGVAPGEKILAGDVLKWELTQTNRKPSTRVISSGSGVKRGGEGWTIDLSSVRWARGEYSLRTSLHAGEKGAETASTSVVFRYQPRAPRLELMIAGQPGTGLQTAPLVVAAPDVTIAGSVDVADGLQATLHVAHHRNGEPLSGRKEPTPTVKGAFQRTIALEEGLNHVAFRAINVGATPGREAEESAVAEAWINYKAPPEAAPLFHTVEIEPKPTVRLIDGRETWVVDRPTLKFTAVVQGAGPLVEASWNAGAEGAEAKPDAVVPASAKLAGTVNLKAGDPRTIVLRAKSKRSDVAGWQREVVYHPPLPAVTVDELPSEDMLEPKVTLSGGFKAATPEPFFVSFRVRSADGRVLEFKPDVDATSNRWKVQLALHPGFNSVDAIVGNKWRGEMQLGGSMKFRYRRPPHIVKAPEAVEAVGTNRVQLSLVVKTPQETPVKDVHVDGESVPFTAKDARGETTIELPQVYVNDGERNLDSVTLKVETDEGESNVAVVKVTHRLPTTPPIAKFLSPPNDTTSEAQYGVSFRVDSERPIQNVDIRRDGRLLRKLDESKAVAADGKFSLQDQVIVDLVPGVNTLELIAVNEGGRSPRAAIVVSRNEPAVSVLVDRVEFLSQGDKAAKHLQPLDPPNAEIPFPPADQSLVSIAGRVRWSDPNAEALRDPSLTVSLKVGDCRQLPVALGPQGRGADANYRAFRAPVVLISKDNRITIETPKLGQQESSRREFVLRCSNPSTKQRLHLLVVGVEEPNAEALKKAVLDALIVEPKRRPAGLQGEFVKNPPFEQCILHSVLAGEVDRYLVYGQIVEIRREIERLQRQSGWLNDLVLIYYRGKEKVDPKRNERWLLTSANYRLPNKPAQYDAIPCHDLPQIPGTTLLLLNVASGKDDATANSTKGIPPGAGFLRYAFKGGNVGGADDDLLSALREAVPQNERIGDIVADLNRRLNARSIPVSSTAALQPGQESRQLSRTAR